MNKFTPFVEWLWSKRDVPYTFRVSVVTEANRREDASVPVPPLTFVEAENLFQFLAKKELVFYHAGTDAYILNKVEEHKWKALIADLKTPDWKRSWWYEKLSSSMVYVFVAVVSGIIGGLTVHTAELFVDHMKEKISKPPADAPAKAPTNEPQKK